MKYQNYKLEDFLLDENFIGWVLEPAEETNLFWENWIKSNPDQLENVLKAKELLLSTKFNVPVPNANDKQELLTKILKGHSSEHHYKISMEQRKFKSFLKIAASFIILTSIGLLFYLQFNDNRSIVAESELVPPTIIKSNPAGRKSQIQLPDGTMVHLNAESSLSFPDRFLGDKRTVELVGEAFFEVKEDSAHPFNVKTKYIQADVLGTSFNINENSVALLTGKVAVSKLDETDKNIVLSPGQKAVLDNVKNTIIKSSFNYQRDMGWKDGIIYFEDADFSEIKKRLEQWYGVEIVSQGNFDWTYTGFFENVSLERLLERLSYLENFLFEINEHKVKIYTK